MGQDWVTGCFMLSNNTKTDLDKFIVSLEYTTNHEIVPPP